MARDGLGLSDIELGYLAALIDLQGTFYIAEEIKKGRSDTPLHSLQIVVTLSDLQALQFWRVKTGLGSIHRSASYKGGQTWHWRISALSAETLLRMVHHRLMVKREQARIALEFRSTFEKRQPWGALQDEVVQLRRAYRRAMLDMTHTS